MQTEQPIRKLEEYLDGRIVFCGREATGRGHAYARTVCVDLAEGVRRMGYLPEAAKAEEPKIGRPWYEQLFGWRRR
jgi:translation elongation factor P/translation initiation factor 5A